MASVKMRQVEKSFGAAKILHGVSLDIQDGEFVILVGPSGCGKSTLLRMVAGLETITGGEIQIGSRVVNHVPPKERDIAMVFQNYALYPHLSVAENIAFGLRLRKESKGVIGERVAWAAKMLDLTPYLDRRPKQLSGGQRQRVAMGRAIVRKPQVFLMDEPLSNLDAKLRVQMRADISKLQRDIGTTTIYVTHDQVEAMTMGDRVAVMSQGLLLQVDTPQRLYDHPSNLFVAGFIGTPPMNLLEATLRSENGTAWVELAGQRLAFDDGLLRRYPGARGANGRQIVLGIRPGDLHPSSGRPELPAMTARLELLEALGSETIAYFRVDAHAVRSGSGGVEDAVEEEEEGSAEGVTATRPNLVAAFDAREGLGLRLDQDVPVGFDMARAHLFDAESGAPLS
jgi:multiple sugar transport system ATP-binding protein